MKDRVELIKELLDHFLNQNLVRKIESDDGEIKIYKVGDNLIRIDIKIDRKEI